MSITSRSIRVFRRLNGAISAELRITVSGEYPPTAWAINDMRTAHPWACIDGIRYDLTDAEIKALRRAVSEI